MLGKRIGFGLILTVIVFFGVSCGEELPWEIPQEKANKLGVKSESTRTGCTPPPVAEEKEKGRPKPSHLEQEILRLVGLGVGQEMSEPTAEEQAYFQEVIARKDEGYDLVVAGAARRTQDRLKDVFEASGSIYDFLLKLDKLRRERGVILGWRLLGGDQLKTMGVTENVQIGGVDIRIYPPLGMSVPFDAKSGRLLSYWWYSPEYRPDAKRGSANLEQEIRRLVVQGVGQEMSEPTAEEQEHFQRFIAEKDKGYCRMGGLPKVIADRLKDVYEASGSIYDFVLKLDKLCKEEKRQRIGWQLMLMDQYMISGVTENVQIGCVSVQLWPLDVHMEVMFDLKSGRLLSYSWDIDR